jgi:hypothetical protein
MTSSQHPGQHTTRRGLWVLLGGALLAIVIFVVFWLIFTLGSDNKDTHDGEPPSGDRASTMVMYGTPH